MSKGIRRIRTFSGSGSHRSQYKQNEQADLYIGATDIIDQLDDGTRKVAGLNNLLDQEAIKDVLRKHI